MLHQMYKANLIVGTLLLGMATASAAHAEPITKAGPEYRLLISLASKAQKLEIFAGLPHPRSESDRFAVEKAKKNHFEHHDFLFYKSVLKVDAKDSRSIGRLVLQPASVTDYKGPSFCGGFHPDFLLVFHLPKENISIQICFGCHEIKIFGRDQVILLSLTNPAVKVLKAELDPLRTHLKEN